MAGLLALPAPALVGAVLAAVILLAALALYAGLSQRARARAALIALTRVETVLAAAPVLNVLVSADGRLEGPARLRDWLGLPQMPRFIGELAAEGAGLAAADLEALQAAIAAAQKGGQPFARAVRPQGGQRLLRIEGRRLERGGFGGGVVLLSLFDATDSEGEIAALRRERDQLAAAFDALTGLIEAAPLPMWYRGADLRLAMVNRTYVAAVEGRDAEDVVARGLELVEGMGEGGPLAGAAAAREQRRPQERTLPATIRGSRRMLRLFDVPLPSGGVAGFAVDIEEVEQARGGLKRFAEAQRAMLDRLSAGVAQFGADRGLVFCNQPFRRLFAMRPEWLTDRPEFDRVLERMREAKRLPEVRDFPAWKAERRAWFLSADEQIEEAWHLPGGTHLRVVAQPLPDGGLLLVFEDRTEQVQLASARDTLLRVRTATFDNLFEALGVFAADGRLQLWNNRLRQIWGFEESFLAGHPRVDLFARAAEPKLSSPNKSVLITELVRSATVERLQRGGTLSFADGRHFQFAAVPLPDGNALFTMLDISDSRRMEQALRDRNEALEAADRVKTAFVANMSYELRTPLTSISGFAEMLRDGLAGPMPAGAGDYIAAILDSADRLGTLIDDVLDLTQNEGRARPIEQRSVAIAEVARMAVAKVEPLVARGKLDFAVEIQDDAGAVTGDAARLAQVVENCLRHALAGTRAGGRILLHADGDARQARIVVSDNGEGMSADAIAHAFDRYAGPAPRRGGEQGLGLGLPLARQFVAAHGGTIDLVSEKGQGSMITIVLPRGAAGSSGDAA